MPISERMMESGVVRLAMTKYTEEDMRNLEEKLTLMKAQIGKGPLNTQATFEADNAFHDAISRMGHNPLIEKINRVVQMLTWSIRLETVTHMVETGRGQELYEAHEKIWQMLKEQDSSNLNQKIRDTYFENVLKDA